jgi:hypothetical protein
LKIFDVSDKAPPKKKASRQQSQKKRIVWAKIEGTNQGGEWHSTKTSGGSWFLLFHLVSRMHLNMVPPLHMVVPLDMVPLNRHPLQTKTQTQLRRMSLPTKIFTVFAMALLWGMTVSIVFLKNLPVQIETDGLLAPAQESGGGATVKLWESSTVLPEWMKDYFEWHHKQLQLLNETNWELHRFLVMRCLEKDPPCGGTSDRLQSAPLLVYHASQLNRILFYKWDVPAPLEEFLLPPPGGMDWRIPEWLDDKLEFPQNAAGISMVDNDAILIDNIGHSGSSHGRKQYDSRKQANESSYEEIYHDCWSVLFQPSPPVAALIEESLKRLDLIPGNYTSVHIRSLYASNQTDNTRMIHKAIKLAYRLRPGVPIYVAADSKEVLREAVAYGNRKIGGLVVARMDMNEPLHIDQGKDYLSKSFRNGRQPAQAYYDTFVDLYLLKLAECTAIGQGAFGSWANRLSTNVNCVISYRPMY